MVFEYNTNLVVKSEVRSRGSRSEFDIIRMTADSLTILGFTRCNMGTGEMLEDLGKQIPKGVTYITTPGGPESLSKYIQATS